MKTFDKTQLISNIVSDIMILLFLGGFFIDNKFYITIAAELIAWYIGLLTALLIIWYGIKIVKLFKFI